MIFSEPPWKANSVPWKVRNTRIPRFFTRKTDLRNEKMPQNVLNTFPEPPNGKREEYNGESLIENIEKKERRKKIRRFCLTLQKRRTNCSKLFKINPDQTLAIIQELYEKKLVTYPRTDARVLSTAVAKEIHKNIEGFRNYPVCFGIWQGSIGTWDFIKKSHQPSMSMTSRLRTIMQ